MKNSRTYIFTASSLAACFRLACLPPDQLLKRLWPSGHASIYFFPITNGEDGFGADEMGAARASGHGFGTSWLELELNLTWATSG
jgi:hypothetical protein